MLLQIDEWDQAASRSRYVGISLLYTLHALRIQMMLGCYSMLTQNIDYFRLKPMNIPKITILLDHGYHLQQLTQEQELVYPPFMRKIKFERSTKPSTQEKAAQGKSGFVPAVARWGKRTVKCLDGARCKILVKNSEANLVECDDETQSLFCQVND